MAGPLETAARRIEHELRIVGTPERAEAEKRYLKSNLEHCGATVGDIRREVRSFVNQHPRLSHAELVSFVERLWARPVHECRMAAVIVLQSHPGLIGRRDLVLLERLIRESKTWALVDGLAVDVLGGLVMQDPSTISALDHWAQDTDFWIRRTALLAHLKPLKAGGHLSPFARHADAMLEEKEFFIRKAIGWVLREVSKTRPDEVFGWLRSRTHRVSGVTVREAVKYLDPGRRELLLDAYRERRPAN